MTAQLIDTHDGTLHHVAPATLTLAKNVRAATADQSLIDSVADRGVLVPITAVVTATGDLMVRDGHRRTLAAIEAGVATVPVYVHGTDSDAAADEIERIVDQRAANSHREGLTHAEDLASIAQMAAFGLKPSQIAKKARIKKETVAAALTVTESSKATEVMAEMQLTIEEAAIIAEFEHDEEAVTLLMREARYGRLPHMAQQLRDKAAHAARTAALTVELEAAGVTVVEFPGHSDKITVNLAYLTDAETGENLDRAAHVTCPGHVAWIDSDWVNVDADGNPVDEEDEANFDEDGEWIGPELFNKRIPVVVTACHAWQTHGHGTNRPYSYGDAPTGAPLTEAEAEAKRAAGRLVRTNNVAWDSAEVVRQDWLATFAGAAKTPKGSARFMSQAICLDGSLIFGGVSAGSGAHKLAAGWLKAEIPSGYGARADLSPSGSATEDRALVTALVQVLAAYEDTISGTSGRSTWRQDNTNSAAGRYLRFLRDCCGYTLAEVEEFAISAQKA